MKGTTGINRSTRTVGGYSNPSFLH